MPSSGKHLVGDLISSLPKVDPLTLNHHIEHILSLNNLGILNNKISEYLLKTNYNVFFNDSLLLRNSNFRKSDKTSLQQNVKFKLLIERLNPNEDQVRKKYKDKLICHYCLHFAALSKKILFQTFKDKLIYIQICRSPITLTMINRIANWTIEIENPKSRDGHIKFFDKKFKKNLPYFIKKESKEYILANKYERTIMILEKNLNNMIFNKKTSKKNKSIEIFIPFENLLKNPKKYLKKVGGHINSKIDKFVIKSLKKNNVPRVFDLNNEKTKTLKFLKGKIEKKYYKKLLNLQKFYEQQILNKF